MSFYKALIFSVVCAFTLSACGAAPRPFRAMSEDEKYSNTLLQQRDGRGINIHVVDNASPDTVDRLERALLASLNQANIPATLGGELSNGHQLMGRSYIENGDSIFRWTLFNQYGQGLGEGEQNIADNLFDPAMSKYIADNVSDEISGILKPENMHALDVEINEVSVAIIKVTGAPGDGNEILPKALRLMLQEANIPTTANPAQAMLHVYANVTLLDTPSGGEKIHIEWTFKKTDGGELGRIVQENEIPTGSLSVKWGDSAYDVAYAMVDTVAAALDAAKNSDLNSQKGDESDDS